LLPIVFSLYPIDLSRYETIGLQRSCGKGIFDYIGFLVVSLQLPILIYLYENKVRGNYVERSMRKRQLILMLREMGLGGFSDETEETLEAILRDENRKKWLKDAHSARNKSTGRLVRRPRQEQDAPLPDDESEPATTSEEDKDKTDRPNPKEAGPLREYSESQSDPGRLTPLPEPASSPDPDKPISDTPVFDRTADIEKIVLRRAAGHCELCEVLESELDQAAGQKLEACSFGPAENVAVKALKTMAALCPACADQIRSDPSPVVIKALTRKARGKIISDTAVSKKRKVAPPKKEQAVPSERYRNARPGYKRGKERGGDGKTR
jgi:hypothetical protein